jgi:hypothetical protein
MRGMGNAFKGAVFLAGMVGATTSAFGAAGVTTADVEPLSPVVTYSRAANPPRIAALTTYIGYTVVVNNTSGNTINNVVFEGTITIADPQEIATFSSSDGASCEVIPPTTLGNSVTVRCPIGQLKAAQSTQPFTVFFVAPEQDDVTPLPDGADYATFAGIIITAEGTNGGNSPNDSIDPWSTTDVALGTPNLLEVKSAVPKSGGSFFTGDGGISGLLGGDPFTTSVVVPSSGIIAKASILESPTSPTSNFIISYKTSIDIIDASDNTIADFSPSLLRIVLRMDASNIVKGTKIGSVVIHYDGNPVADCPSPLTASFTGFPCIAERKFYRNRSVQGWTPDLDGDFEWTILNTKNGVLEFF